MNPSALTALLLLAPLTFTTLAIRAEEPGAAAKIGVGSRFKEGALPPLTSALAERAARAFGQGRWDDARKAYEEILKEDPDNALTLANLGAVEQAAGRLKEAQEYLQRAVSSNPELLQSWISLGMISYEKGDTYLALSALSRAVHLDPADPKAHNYLAVIVKKLGWLDAAESELQRAIALNPDYANAHFNLALMYLERKPPALELAKRHYDKALALGAEKDELVEQKLKAQ